MEMREGCRLLKARRNPTQSAKPRPFPSTVAIISCAVQMNVQDEASAPKLSDRKREVSEENRLRPLSGSPAAVRRGKDEDEDEGRLLLEEETPSLPPSPSSPSPFAGRTP